MVKIVVTGSHPTPAEALIAVLPKHVRAVRYSRPAGPKIKRHDWRSVFGLVRLPGVTAGCVRELKRLAPRLVVSFGGYSAVPVCLAAKWLKLPLVIHEQTFGAGLASRLTAIWADRVAVSWSSSRKFFPKDKTVLTGNPIRPEIARTRRRPAGVLYVTGGSQGSLAINRALKPILPRLLREFIVYHQYGRQTPLTRHRRYFARPYFPVRELAGIYSRAKLVIGRAGINTLTELAYLGIPAVLIPLPFTQKGEQLTNARWLEKLGLALVLPQENLTPATLLVSIRQASVRLRAGRGLGGYRQLIGRAADNLYRLCSNWF